MTDIELADAAYDLASKLEEMLYANRDRDDGNGYRQRVKGEFADELAKLLTKVANFKVRPAHG